MSSPSTRNLPDPVVLITGHEPKAGKSITLPPKQLMWKDFNDGQMPMASVYTNLAVPDLNNDADLHYDAEHSTDKVGLVTGGGCVLRYVDVAPGYTTMMHRTQSLDYGILLNGQIECVFDSGEAQPLHIGQAMIQRVTMHAWRNPSKTEWARILFVLVDCLPLKIDGRVMGEDLGSGASYLPPSDN